MKSHMAWMAATLLHRASQPPRPPIDNVNEVKPVWLVLYRYFSRQGLMLVIHIEYIPSVVLVSSHEKGRCRKEHEVPASSLAWRAIRSNSPRLPVSLLR